MKNHILFSSDFQAWRTPKWLFEELNREFSFDLDAAADEHNALCSKFICKGQNALLEDCWDSETAVWLNPPYGRGLQQFMAKTIEQVKEKGKTVVCLVFARTDTKWWHDYVMPHASEVRLVRGRLKFTRPAAGTNDPYDEVTGPATAPSAIVVFRPDHSGGPVFSTFHQPQHRILPHPQLEMWVWNTGPIGCGGE